jgi:hypothetical protein
VASVKVKVHQGEQAHSHALCPPVLGMRGGAENPMAKASSPSPRRYSRTQSVSLCELNRVARGDKRWVAVEAKFPYALSPPLHPLSMVLERRHYRLRLFVNHGRNPRKIASKVDKNGSAAISRQIFFKRGDVSAPTIARSYSSGSPRRSLRPAAIHRPPPLCPS